MRIEARYIPARVTPQRLSVMAVARPTRQEPKMMDNDHQAKQLQARLMKQLKGGAAGFMAGTAVGFIATEKMGLAGGLGVMVAHTAVVATLAMMYDAANDGEKK